MTPEERAWEVADKFLDTPWDAGLFSEILQKNIAQALREYGDECRIDALEETAVIATREKGISGSPGPLYDAGWSACGQMLAGVYRKLKEGDTPEGAVLAAQANHLGLDTLVMDSEGVMRAEDQS